MKVKFNLPASKKESRAINAFSIMARQVSNTPGPYSKHQLDPDRLSEHSPKLHAVADHINKAIKANPKDYKVIAYSNFIDSGLQPIARALAKNKISHALFTGGTSKAMKKSILNDYNAGKIKALLVSSSGTEGLDTKGTREVLTTEPHWNNEKLRQVVARAVRYKSHAHLPSNERKVKVTHFQASEPKPGLFRRIGRKLTGAKPRTMIDEYIHARAKDKDHLSNEFLDAFREASKYE
jgi:ERCC4-related helicase